MSNEYVTTVGVGAPERGRKEISLEVATKTQSMLLERMIPKSIQPYLLDPAVDVEKNDPILIELGNRFALKYLLGFNGFTEYCNENSADREFMERALTGQFTEADYVGMVNFFEHHEAGGKLFADEVEVQEFLNPYVN